MKLSLILAESALELIPRELWRDPSVVSDARRRGIEPSRILLDRSFHHRAMLRLKDAEKRGRPDLVHVALLSASGTPLYLGGMARVFVQTHGDVTIEIAERTRIPKSYLRFRGLMEQVLFEKPRSGLLTVAQSDVARLLEELRPARAIGLSTRGRAVPMADLVSMMAATRNPALVVGGFAHGHFSPKTTDAFDDLVSIGEHHLDAHVVVARVLYELEKGIDQAND
ncbi:MAG: ribosome biogenesis protein [Nitrososphaerota archaeon]|nr:ribosome biogenesis protein [Nitrososphaerota archaeon]